MAGYLDQYGAGEEHRNRILAWSIISVLVVVSGSALGWYLLKNHHQESVVKAFAARSGGRRLSGRVSRLGMHAGKPCSAYHFEKFHGTTGARKQHAAGPPVIGHLPTANPAIPAYILT